MSRRSSRRPTDSSAIERELNRKLKRQIATRLHARYEHGVLVISGEVVSRDGLVLVELAAEALLPGIDFESRIRVRTRSEKTREFEGSTENLTPLSTST